MTHDDAWHLLPWFVNGALRPDARTGIDAHLAACAQCRSEVTTQMRVRDAIAREEPRQNSAQSSFDELWLQIQQEDNAPRRPVTARRASAGVVQRWLVAAVIVQAVGLVAMGWMKLNDNASPSAPASYQTLSTPASASASGQIRAVFAPDLGLRELQNLLLTSRLGVVGGPTSAGVYTLSLSDKNQNVEAALADLRGNAAVRFAEPIDTPRPSER